MIEENIKINPQPEEFDDSAELEPVTFVTEDGGEENFWHIMTFPMKVRNMLHSFRRIGLTKKNPK